MKRLMIGLTTGAVLAASATAWATGTISSIVAPDGTINGCYRAEGADDGGQKGQLRVIATGASCTKNELAISWSQKGPKGDQGLKGDTGATGAQGLKGDQGAQGPAGIQGELGVQGLPGEKGADGAPGATGAQGAPGPKGDPGEPGATGAKGDQGPAGLQGSAGPAGPKGDRGEQGLQGVAGPPGPTNALSAFLSGNGFLTQPGAAWTDILSLPAESGQYLVWAYVQARPEVPEGVESAATASCDTGGGFEDLSIHGAGSSSVLSFPGTTFVPAGASIKLRCTSFLNPVRYYNARLYAVRVGSLSSHSENSP